MELSNTQLFKFTFKVDGVDYNFKVEADSQHAALVRLFEHLSKMHDEVDAAIKLNT